jgi:hypothetical protein
VAFWSGGWPRASFDRAAVPVLGGICGSCSTMLSSGVDVDLHGGAAAVERSRTDRLQSMLVVWKWWAPLRRTLNQAAYATHTRGCSFSGLVLSLFSS